MEKQKFEESWKEAFKQAEVSPSENLWTNIELDLEKAEGGKMRRKLFLFKMMAAASVIFALGMGAVGYYYLSQPNTSDQPGPVALNDVKIENDSKEDLRSGMVKPSESNTQTHPIVVPHSSANENELVGASNEYRLRENSRGKSENADKTTRRNVESKGNNLKPVTEFQSDNLQTTSTKPDERSISNPFYPKAFLDRGLPSLVDPLKRIEPNFPKTEPDPLILLLARLDEDKHNEKNKKEDKSEKLWTSVGFAAGSFTSNTSGSFAMAPGSALADQNSLAISKPSVAAAYAASSSPVTNQTKASGMSYSFGVNVGAKLSKRWILQGGFNYLTQSSDYTSTGKVSSADAKSFRPASINEFSASAYGPQGNLVATSPYSVNNSLQYISFPVQAGYMLINHGFGVQLNAGVSTDLFLKNVITPEDGSLDKVTQGNGSDSPYRSVNFSGLVGTELSYRLASHYRIAVNPGLRYPFNSIYKSELGVSASPLTFDVGLRFRYIFN